MANLANTKWCKNTGKWPKPWQMGTHMRVLSESCLMNTNMTGFRWFSLHPCALDESSLCIRRVKTMLSLSSLDGPVVTFLLLFSSESWVPDAEGAEPGRWESQGVPGEGAVSDHAVLGLPAATRQRAGRLHRLQAHHRGKAFTRIWHQLTIFKSVAWRIECIILKSEGHSENQILYLTVLPSWNKDYYYYYYYYYYYQRKFQN